MDAEDYNVVRRLKFFKELVSCWDAQVIINKEVQERYRDIKEKPPIAINFGYIGKEYLYDEIKKEWREWI